MDKAIIPKEHIEIISKIQKLKENKATSAHLQIPHKLLEFIFTIEGINSTSKLILINLLKRQNWTNEHLYIAVSYTQLQNDLNLKKGSISNSLKQLRDENNKLVEVKSGTKNKEEIRKIKEIIYKQTQRATRSFNELNIYDLTPLYEKYFTYLNSNPSDNSNTNHLIDHMQG